MIWLSMISSLFTASFALLTTGDSHRDAIRSKGTQIQARFSETMDEKEAMDLAELGSRRDPGGYPPIRSAERSEGKECVRTCRSRWSPALQKTPESVVIRVPK